MSLAEGILKKVYLGYISRQFSNQGSSDTVYDEAITYTYKKGSSIDTSKATSVKTGLELGASFFGLVNSKFNIEVTHSVAETLKSTEEETYEAQNKVNYPVPAGKAITVVILYYQNVLEGALSAGNVELKYHDKFLMSNDVFIYDGLLTNSQVAALVRQILTAALSSDFKVALNLPPVVPMNADIPLLEKKIGVVNRKNVADALKSWPDNIIQKRHLTNFKGVTFYKPKSYPVIRRIDNRSTTRIIR